MNVLEVLATLLQTGLGSLAAYLAAHVLLCLLPAFFIAGALSALIPKEAITKYLGRDDLLSGVGGGRVRAGGLLVHHHAALRQHI